MCLKSVYDNSVLTQHYLFILIKQQFNFLGGNCHSWISFSFDKAAVPELLNHKTEQEVKLWYDTPKRFPNGLFRSGCFHIAVAL